MELQFNDIEAMNYGVDNAVFLSKIRSLIHKNKLERRYVYKKEVWTPISVCELQFSFPFWSKHKIRNILKTLVEKKILKRERISKLSRYDCFAFVNE